MGGEVNRRLVTLLREALAASSQTDSPLRARLLARLSLESTFSDETALTEPFSREAVEMARRLGDAASLAPALRARWMAVWGPEGLAERSALAEELLGLARATGDQELELVGRGRRVSSSLESGDIRAVETDIAACARLAEELHMPVHQWMATTMRAMWALLQGSLDEAETLAEQAHSLQPHGPNGYFAYNDLLEVLRWDQGRLQELRRNRRDQVTPFPRVGFSSGLVSMADADPGAGDRTRRVLQSLVDELPDRPRDGLWLPAVALACLLTSHLDQPDAADSLYPLLVPYTTRIIAVTMPHPIVCFGSASFHLALLATVSSRWAEAGDHFEAAIRAHEQLGARPLLARTHYEYARMLLRQGQAADQRRALGLLDRALATADAVGMTALSQDGRRLRQAVGDEPSSARRATADTVGGSAVGSDLFRHEGEYWTVSYEGVVVRLKDAKGLRHLARLLAHPAREFHAAELEAAAAGSVQPASPGRGSQGGGDELEVRPNLGDAGALLDATAKAAYRARLQELRAELEEAEGFNDPARATKARQEMDFLVDELARAVGLGGRDRKAASHAERARLNVTRAIRTAMANLARANPELAAHLASTIRTGRYCSYTPDPRTPTTWKL